MAKALPAAPPATSPSRSCGTAERRCPGTLEAGACLTPRQLQLIRETHALLLPLKLEFAAVFFELLRIRDRRLTNFLPEELPRQARLLMQAIGYVLGSLQKLEPLFPAAEEQALRYACSGVKPRHYAIVGAVLIDALDYVLEPGPDDEMRKAWRRAYSLVASEMMKAAYPPKPLSLLKVGIYVAVATWAGAVAAATTFPAFLS